MYDIVQGTKGNRGWGYKKRNLGHGGICSTYNTSLCENALCKQNLIQCIYNELKNNFMNYNRKQANKQAKSYAKVQKKVSFKSIR